MARSLLRALTGGTRQMLAAQLFVGVLAVALAGWTLAITSQVIRERDRLRERVVQLESELGTRGIVVPTDAAVVRTPGAQAYPNEVGPALRQAGSSAPPAQSAFDPRELLGDLFSPAPPVRTLVLHARSDGDGEAARQLGEEIAAGANVRVIVNVMTPRDPQQAGYVYFDGRQSRAAAALVAQFNDAARRAEIPLWSAQPRGVALPAEGEFTPDRVDIVLPPLPPPPVALRPVTPEPVTGSAP